MSNVRAVVEAARWIALAVVWGLAIAAPLAPCPTVAAEPALSDQDGPSENPQSTSGRNSLDDALLDDLDNALLEGIGDLKDRPGLDPGAADKDAAGAPSGSAAEGDDLDMPAEDADPLVHISQEVRSVEELIPKSTSRQHAEALQRRIVDDLGRLIEQAESQRASQQASSQKKKQQQQSAKRQSVNQPKPGQPSNSAKNSTKPAQDSSDRLGRAEAARPTAEQIRGLLDESWGNLPPRAREQMLQNSPERFLPQYELMIEKYYRRLAEEQRPR